MGVSTGTAVGGGWPGTAREPLSGAEWCRVGGMTAVIALLHLVGWGVFVLAVLPAHYRLLGVGVAVTAYTLGLRHAFDADHISAIDNTTRKLMAEEERPLSVGFFFSLGHSTVVVGLGVALTFAARGVFGVVRDPHSALQSFGGVFGTAVSGSFLYLIAAMNLVILVGIARIFAGMRRGLFAEDELEQKLQARGFMFRILGRRLGAITRPWQMYPVGVLFGLGFDTATEVALLAATAGAAEASLPWYAVLSLPVLFTAGMTLLDTIDGSFMNFAYGWAFAQPVRKVYYNLAITGLSVVVALAVGTFEILGLVSTELHLGGGFWAFFAGFNINVAGFIIAGLFVVVWVAALSIWRFGRIEQRWESAAATQRAQRGGFALRPAFSEPEQGTVDS
ncbi:MAG: HoxN/HupN/NixA family nickel/cobalt transporter [Acidimicrobiales bacterium]|jgi:high-affinity nickel-transport protein